MPEIADRVPGGVILASYSNTIRDRAVMRYADPTARDASVPLPQIGELAYLTTLGDFQIYDGVTWVTFASELHVDTADALLSDRLDVMENTIVSPFTATPKSLSQTPSNTASVTVPVDGEYVFTFNGAVDYDIQIAAGLSLAPIGAQFRLDGSLPGGEDMGLWGATGEGVHALPLSLIWPTEPVGIVAGTSVEVWLDVSSASVIGGSVRDFVLVGRQVTTGTIQPPVR